MQNIRYDKQNEALIILDQTLLPRREEYIQIVTAQQMFEAIRSLRVRGAPAIGIFAAYCMYSLARAIPAEEELLPRLKEQAEYLCSSRPTAVNLSWAVGEMLSHARSHSHLARQELLNSLYEKALAIHEDDMQRCLAISRHGLTLVRDGDGILTHCNAGPIATSRYGTALGPILLGQEQGVRFRVYADETRPLLQGARLTSYELLSAGVDVTLICDNMASIVMKQGWIQACFVGCDRLAANGDAANKIGTSGVAILARHYGIPFYVLAPCSTIDMDCPDGAHIPIEQRDPDEIRSMWYSEPMAPAGVKCYNPAFDVTDNSLITAIVTENGICYPPYTQSLRSLFL